ncbi:MAG: Hsp20/alpha crystallin family protein [Bradymonadaceae bacterium]
MADDGKMSVHEKQELDSGEGTRQGNWFKPPVDIFETGGTLKVLADVPGADPDDIEINLEDSHLTLVAPTSGFDDRWERVYGEYSEGHFTREFRLGKEIDQSNITAELKNGVLELTLPKVEQTKAREIEIQ